MYSDHLTSAPDWCTEELESVDLKDSRLNQRYQTVASALAAQPTVSINQASEDWADTKAAYRFFDNKKVTHESLLLPHQQRTVERMSQHTLVLASQDTTFINFSHHPKTTGTGPIGNKQTKQSGFVMHSTLVSTSEGLPLGILTQDIDSRPENEPSKTPAECKKQPIEEKESYKWIKAFEETLALSPDGTDVLTICDREADIYEMFVLAKEKEAKLLVRSSVDRLLIDESEHKLRAKVKNAPLAGHLDVAIPRSSTQPKRNAALSVRYISVTLNPPWRPNQKKLAAVTLNAVFIREDNPPDDVEEPVEWLLLTNYAVHCFNDAVQIVKWYRCRWQIEIFHKILKSGCAIEECRLQTDERLHPFIALKSIIAWRLHWMTYINRHEPEMLCTAVLAEHEWQALYMRIHRTATLPDKPPTVRQAIRWIGQLGGFLGRKSDGEPGITVIWRGWQRLQDIADTWYLVNEPVFKKLTYG